MVFSGGAGRGGKPEHEKVKQSVGASFYSWMIYLDDSILVTDEKAAIYVMLNNLYLSKIFKSKKDCTKGSIGCTDPSAPRIMVFRLSSSVQGRGQDHLQFNLGAFGVNHSSAPAGQPTKVCLMVQNLLLVLKKVLLVDFSNPN